MEAVQKEVQPTFRKKLTSNWDINRGQIIAHSILPKSRFMDAIQGCNWRKYRAPDMKLEQAKHYRILLHFESLQENLDIGTLVPNPRVGGGIIC